MAAHRLGYGDLGIATVMAFAARTMHRRDWMEEAFRVAGCVATLPVESDGTSLCHGAAGIAHMFTRLFEYSGVDEFRNVAVT
jgi:hypothetical protein